MGTELQFAGSSFLLTAAQIGLALGGFAAIVGQFRQTTQRQNGAMRYLNIQGTRLIIEHAFAVVLFCLVPFPVFFFTSSEENTLDLLLVALIAFIFLDLVVQGWRIIEGEESGINLRWPRLFRYLFFVPGSALVVLLGLALAQGRRLPAYAAGIIWLLIPPAIQIMSFMKNDLAACDRDSAI